MLRALWTAASGMTAQQLNVDNIANNLANVNTTGFKKMRIDYQDLYYQTIQEPGAPTAEGIQTPTGLQIGLGTIPASTTKIFSTGDFQQTGNSLDLAIEGNGFFKVTMPDGTIGYSRAGSFRLDSQSRVVTTEGFLLEPALTLPTDTQDITVGTDGTVSALSAGATTPTSVGTLELASFVNPAGLKNLGHNLYGETAASGTPTSAAPGTTGMGQIRQGILEMSNVSVVDEMVTMISAQRAYEMASKAIQTADEMIRISNNIRG